MVIKYLGVPLRFASGRHIPGFASLMASPPPSAALHAAHAKTCTLGLNVAVLARLEGGFFEFQIIFKVSVHLFYFFEKKNLQNIKNRLYICGV